MSECWVIACRHSYDEHVAIGCLFCACPSFTPAKEPAHVALTEADHADLRRWLRDRK